MSQASELMGNDEGIDLVERERTIVAAKVFNGLRALQIRYGEAISSEERNFLVDKMTDLLSMLKE